MNHFTDLDGYNAIRSQPAWRFKAGQPPGDHPFGAYFTTLGPSERKLAARLRIPRRKVAYMFAFEDDAGLSPLPRGDRGEFVFYSPTDYDVIEERQHESGPTGL